MKKSLKPAYRPKTECLRGFIIDFYRRNESPEGVPAGILVGHSDTVFTSYREAYRKVCWYQSFSVIDCFDFRIRRIKLCKKFLRPLAE